MVVIGGGATGAGVAVDAAARGFQVLLLERGDFGQGTSSRSTKLVHGGVRYLRQGDVSLVKEALRERARLLRNAPHVAHALPFVIPAYRWSERRYYRLGLWLYDWLAAGQRLGTTRIVAPSEVVDRVPTVRAEGLRGGVLYYDGQFDDARLLIHLVLTAIEHGAVALNGATVTGFTRGQGERVNGVNFRDAETGQEIHAPTRVVVNATGAFCDDVRRLAERDPNATVTHSQGTHLVFAHSFLPGNSALMVPRTSDGRVLFAIPWHLHTLVGTTDVAIPAATPEPRATDAEIDFILETVGRYLTPAPTRADILSVFAGVRPLLRARKAARSAALSRRHGLLVEPNGLVTITGGKWTTYRQMAADAVDKGIEVGSLSSRPSRTESLPIHGYDADAARFGHLAVYGADAPQVLELAGASAEIAAPLHPALPYIGAEVIWAARHELARTVEDVLARRTRALFLNAAAARAMAPRVAELLAAELGHGAAWQKAQLTAFDTLARGYSVST